MVVGRQRRRGLRLGECPGVGRTEAAGLMAQFVAFGGGWQMPESVRVRKRLAASLFCWRLSSSTGKRLTESSQDAQHSEENIRADAPLLYIPLSMHCLLHCHFKSTTYPGISTQVFSSWGRGFCGACIDDEGIAAVVIASPAGQAQAVHRLGRVSIQAALAQKVRRASQLFHPGATDFKIGGCPLMHVSSA